MTGLPYVPLITGNFPRFFQGIYTLFSALFTVSYTTDNVWFYDMQSDGYSLDDKRTLLDSSNIPDIVARFRGLAAEIDRARTEQSFLVPKAEIVGNGYDLSINKYKQSAYVEENYPHPREILAEINTLEQEIADGLQELEAMLRE